MDLILTILFVAIGAFLLGAIIAWAARAREISATAVRLSEAEKLLAGANARAENASTLEMHLAAARQQINELTAEKSSIAAKYEAADKSHQEQVVQLTQLRQEVQDQFKLLAGEALKVSSEDFSKRAIEIFQHHKDATTKDITNLVKPLGESLQAYDLALKDIEKARISGFTSITEALNTVNAQHGEVRTATSNLVNALRASPKTRGRWGEETLRRVMELSGMVENCDFETEKHFPGGEESLRPDVIINITGGRTIVVDAKAPVTAYLESIDADTDEKKEMLLNRHAKQLRERLTDLSSKSYWQKVAGSADCVVMFVPGDNFVSAAFERDPNLFEDAIKNRVLICTPTTFIALAKAISYGWRQEKLAQSALDVSRLGKELYSRLTTLGGHVVSLGKNINSAAQKYNLLVGSLENSVLPQARRFNDLGIAGSIDPLPDLVQVDTVARFPEGGRDLLLSQGQGEPDLDP